MEMKLQKHLNTSQVSTCMQFMETFSWRRQQYIVRHSSTIRFILWCIGDIAMYWVHTHFAYNFVKEKKQQQQQ